MPMFRFFGLLAVMAIGVVIGLQLAERGIERVSGAPKQVTYIKKVDRGYAEVAVVQTPNSQRMSDRTNYISRVGTMLGGWVKGAARSAVQWLGAYFWP